jgi:hypothetical protein
MHEFITDGLVRWPYPPKRLKKADYYGPRTGLENHGKGGEDRGLNK